MKNKRFLRPIALVLAFIMAMSFMVACEKQTDDDTPDGEDEGNELYELADFSIVRYGGASKDVTDSAVKLKQSIESVIGPSLEVKIDDESAESEKEILVGMTNRKQSQETVKYLQGKNDRDSWAIRIYSNKIVITGTDDASTVRAVQTFINNYVKVSPKGTGLDISAGNQMLGIYDTDYITTLSNGTEIGIDYVSDVIETGNKYTLPDGTYFVPSSGSYPSVTELNYQQNEEDNGKLIAIYSGSTAVGNATGSGFVMMSENQGKTWSCIARPAETLYPSLQAQGSMAHVYELPAKVGDMPAGTLLYSYNSVNYDIGNNGIGGKSILAVWRSFDCGYTWEEYVIIDEARGIKEGIWEPFMIYCEEDQYLYCFYSDDSDPDHDQKIAYKRSKDGVNWEGEGGKIGTGTGKDVEPVDVVAINDFDYRPGMPVITKMGNGEYFLVYEQFGDWSGCPIYYKTTKDLSDWGDPNNIGVRIETSTGFTGSSSPSCAWLPVGGECGTLFVTAKSSTNKGLMFVSTDYGKTWETIEDPLESDPIKADQDRVGYSGGMWVGSDGKTLYYINSDNSVKDHGKQMIYIAKITVYDPIDE